MNVRPIAVLALALGLVFLIFPSPAALSQDAAAGPNPDLAAILQKSSEYCRQLARSALYFICEEKIVETVSALRDAEVTVLGNFTEGDSPMYTSSMRRRAKKNSSLYDYQLIKKGDAVEEKRTLLEDNGKKPDPKNAQPKAHRFLSKKAVFGPVGFLAEEWHEVYNYELLKRERVFGRTAFVIKATPKVPIEGKPNYGRLWVDAQDFSVLKIELEAESLAGFEKVQEEAKKQGLKPEFTVVHEFAVVKNGLRFPSRTLFEEKYHTLKGGHAGRGEIKAEITYGNYKFFTVETEVIYK